MLKISQPGIGLLCFLMTISLYFPICNANSFDSDIEGINTYRTDSLTIICEHDLNLKSHPKDKTTYNPYRFKPKELIVPLSLITVGSFGVCNGAFRHIAYSVKDGMEKLRKKCYFHIDDYIQYAPTVAYVGLGILKMKCKHSFKERFAVGATSYLAMGILTNGLKYTVKEKRPDSNARNSFPSGHTATVFMGAELLREEYGLGIGIGGYVIATSVAFLRLYNERHWLNDVIAGAGIGILSARIGYWMLPLYQKWFRWNEKRNSIISVAPSYNPSTKEIFFGLVAQF